MVIVQRNKRIIFTALALMVCAIAFAPASFAAEGAEQAGGEVSVGAGLKALGLAIGAGIAIAGAGLATGRAQAGVGAGGTGALAEKPELFGNVLILFAIPETIVILGFVIAFMLLGKI